MRTAMHRSCACLVAVLSTWVCFLPAVCRAAVPQKMNYQGKLTDTAGKLVTDGSYEMIFSLHDAASGGTEEWSEAWEGGNAVTVTGGLFNALLGTHTPINLPFDEDYWLQIKVKNGGSYETLAPRQELASCAYAFRAGKVADGAITDASISASAAIADTKLATISTAGKVSGAAVSGGTLGSVNGSAIDNLNASSISSGTLGSSYLPSDGYASTYVNVGGDTMTGSLGLPSNGLAVGTSQLVVSGGNVGIGTTAPSAPLTVYGDRYDTMRVGRSDAASFAIGIPDGTVTDSLEFYGFQNGYDGYVFGGVSGTKMTILSNGKVGIGTASPGEELHVVGNIKMVDGNQGEGKIMTSDADGVAGWAAAPGGGVPIGAVMPFAGSSAPQGWLLCNGLAVSRTTYAGLFALIGITYGAGDGSTTFNVPELRGNVPVGKNSGTFSTLGATGGEETHTLTIGEMPAHTHVIDASYYHSGKNVADSSNDQSGQSADFTSQSAGGGGAHTNLQPYIVLNYIIKT